MKTNDGIMMRPTELRVSGDRHTLKVAFTSGDYFELPAELLRVESPSAEVRGHGGDEKLIVPGKRHVRIEGVEPVGNYAIRLTFSDGHDTGLYTWGYLRELGFRGDSIFAEYLAALAVRGLNRD